MSKLKSFIIFALLLFSLVLGTLYFIFSTQKGAHQAANFFLSHFVQANKKEFAEVRGNIEQGLSFKNIELKDLQGLPDGSEVKIQKLDVIFDSLDIKKANVAVENGRLFLPHCEPIVVMGNYSNGNLSFNIFTKAVDVSDILAFSDNKSVRNVAGAISNIDLYVTGPLNKVNVRGDFKVDQIVKSDFSLSNSEGSLSLTLSSPDGLGKDVKPDGEIDFKNGVFQIRKIQLQLEPSRIMFAENFREPSFDIKGTATVDEFKIILTLQGTRSAPALDANSVPPRSREELLIMLVTGKSWQGDGAPEGQRASSQLAGEMIDFFLILGDNPLVEALGITDTAIKYDEQTRGIGVTTKIGDRLKVGYEVDEHTARQQGEPPSVTHKLGGEVQVTPHVSISAEKEFQPRQDLPGATDTTPTDDKVLLKFKKQF